jgi:hypothetical protein
MSDPVIKPAEPRNPRTLSPTLYWVVIVFAALALALTLFNMRNGAAAGHARFAWLAPAGILLLGIGGLVGRTRPGLQRLLLGLSAILVIAGLVETYRR